MSTPSARPETQVEVPDLPPPLTQGAARALLRILQAAAQTRAESDPRSGGEPEAIAS